MWIFNQPWNYMIQPTQMCIISVPHVCSFASARIRFFEELYAQLLYDWLKGFWALYNCYKVGAILVPSGFLHPIMIL